MGYKLNFWDYVFYISMSIVLIWIILKSVGIIQTPFWLQYGLPASSFVIGVFALYYNLVKSIIDLSLKTGNIEKDVEIIKYNDKKIETKINHIDKDINNLKTDVGILKSDVVILKLRI